MTQPEALRLAELLENSWKSTFNTDEAAAELRRLHEENQTLRQALAQPEQEPYDQTALELCEKCGWKAIIPDEGCLVCARDKQKPAAWKYQYLDKYGFWKIGVHLFEPDSIICEVKNIQPLYTVPQKREWIGLTAEQIFEHEWWDEETAFAVNQFLMEKNCA